MTDDELKKFKALEDMLFKADTFIEDPIEAQVRINSLVFELAEFILRPYWDKIGKEEKEGKPVVLSLDSCPACNGRFIKIVYKEDDYPFIKDECVRLYCENDHAFSTLRGIEFIEETKDKPVEKGLYLKSCPECCGKWVRITDNDTPIFECENDHIYFLRKWK